MSVAFGRESQMNEDSMTVIERRLASMWMKVLHIDVLRPTSSFVSLGGDVRAANLIVDELGLAFNIRVTPRVLLENDATLGRVASVIEDELNAGPLSN
jgi:hypothetical protein